MMAGSAMEFLTALWRQLTLAVQAAGAFPLFVSGSLFLGLWVFWRGRAVLREPTHHIGLPPALGGVGAPSTGPRGPPRGTRPKGRHSVGGEPVQATPLAADHPKAPEGAVDYEKVPYHDAPLWLLGWALVFGVVVLLGLVDAVWSAQRELAHPLEVAVLGRLLPYWLVPLPRPAVALAVYGLLGYAALELAVAALKSVLRLERLHVLHENDARRRLARFVYGLCGFQDLRWLDYAAARSWLPVAVGGGLLVLGADLAVFYGGASGLLGALAVAHLFPAVLARFLDYVFLYPVRRQPMLARPRGQAPLERIPAELARRGWVVADREGQPLLWRVHAAEAGVVAPWDAGGNDLLLEVHTAFAGGAGWYGHQGDAWKPAAAGHSVALVSPSESGRTAWAFVCAMQGVLERDENVILIYPDVSACRQEYDRFCDTLFRTGLRWNLRAIDLTRTDARTLQWSGMAPSLAFGDLASIEAVLSGEIGGAGPFLSAVGTLVIEDVDRLSGAPASTLHLLLRRLRAARRRAGLRPLRLLLTSLPVAEALQEQLGILVGEPLAVIQSDTSPTVDVLACLVRPPADEVSGARPTRPHEKGAELEDLLAVLEELGHAPALVETGWDGSPGRAPGQGPALSEAAVSVARLDDRGAFPTVLRLRNAGARSVEGAHLSLWIAKPEPFPALLLDSAEACRLRSQTLWDDRNWLPMAGAICFSVNNATLKARHLRAALRETPLTEVELADLFGSGFVRQTLEELRTQHVLGPTERGRAGGERYRLQTDRADRADYTRVLCDDPVGVESVAGHRERLLLYMDRERGETALYPGRVFRAQGRRYRVPLEPLPGDAHARRIVRPEEASVFTVKIRRTAVRWLGETSQVRTQLGASPLVLRRGTADVEEEVLGYREWTEDTNQHVATHFYEKLHRPNPRGSRRSRVLEVSFPDETLSPDAQRGLEDLLASVIRARFGNDLDCPEVVETAGSTEGAPAPGLCLVETYPGGVGYVERTTPLLVVEWLRLARILAQRVGLQAPELLLSSSESTRERSGAGVSASAIFRLLQGDNWLRSPRPERGWAGNTRPCVPARDSGEAAVVSELLQFLERVVPEGRGDFAWKTAPRESCESPAEAQVRAPPPATTLLDAYRRILGEAEVRFRPIDQN
jgi:hypothetical protein